ncbi:hypothetical protein MKJ04_05255 [Pontibacter sp. E15-1]|uniref:hypothetical protein n=1 Tax=Pontibacter sp. E15-1 TaxID=2919918 RepID=UPI001F4F607B|nr:hypothetical protein [Pontibacter sp. E15-1]MCJ8164241.1 hypothetical protein [Pontibacter sp. E15-1]
MQDTNDLTPLITVLAQVRERGYVQDFRVTENGRLSTTDGTQEFEPGQVQIVNFYRFEGESNPDDMAILYVLETATGAKGTLSDAYGTYADDKIETFMSQVRDLGKNLDTRE